MNNSTDFKKLRPNQKLFLVRYSHSPKPDFVEVLFKGIVNNSTEIEFTYVNDEKKRLKKFPIRKAEYRLFLHKLEMVKSLVSCFIRREVPLGTDYADLIEESQEAYPELWI